MNNTTLVLIVGAFFIGTLTSLAFVDAQQPPVGPLHDLREAIQELGILIETDTIVIGDSDDTVEIPGTLEVGSTITVDGITNKITGSAATEIATTTGDITIDPGDNGLVLTIGTDGTIDSASIDSTSIVDGSILPADLAGGAGGCFLLRTMNFVNNEFTLSSECAVQNIAVAFRGQDTVSILVNNGAGLFGTAVSNLETGDFPKFITEGDFDGDGNPDLATANLGSGENISIFLSEDNGTFGAGVEYTVGGDPLSIVVGDFDVDTHLDLAVANSDDDDVSILINLGDGTFATKVDYPVGACPESITAGFFDGDSVLDLAVTNVCDEDVSILLNLGDGTFDTAVDFAVGVCPEFIAVGDFGGAGDDLAVANGCDNDVSILINLGGSPDFETAVDYSAGEAGGKCIVVGDFDGDFIQDFVVANVVSETISIFLGVGDTTFVHTDTIFELSAAPDCIAIGDLDGDGNLDLVTTNFDSNVSVLLGDGTGSFGTPTDFELATFPKHLVVFETI